MKRYAKRFVVVLCAIGILFGVIDNRNVSAQVNFVPGIRCEGAPFVWPTWGNQNWLWHLYTGRIEYAGDDGYHDGIDIGQVSNTPNVEGVYAVCAGTLTPAKNWSFYIQCDPIDTSFNVLHHQVWVYYTHMANRDGSISYILSDFRPGKPASRVSPGQLLGYQGNKGPEGMSTHLHVSVNSCKSESCNTDPSLYFTNRENILNADHVNSSGTTPPFPCNTVDPGDQDLCGNLGGRTLSAGTHNVTCDIYVNAGQTLHIEPGATLNYNGHSFTVNGQLIWGP